MKILFRRYYILEINLISFTFLGNWIAEHPILQLKTSGWKTERLLSPTIVWKANWICGSSDGKID